MDGLAHRRSCLEQSVGDVPVELLQAALIQLERDDIETAPTRALLEKMGVRVSRENAFTYVRRANNQVPAEVEALIRELLDRGWTKTAISKHLKINRRVVIRVAREAQNAQFADTDKHEQRLTHGR
jgi:hypothetical protein